MNRTPQHQPNDDRHHLQAELDPELRAIDRQLTQWAADSRRDAPRDLEHRVLQAVASELATPTLKPVHAPQPVVIGRIGWSRMALAACVLLACVVTVTVMNGRPGVEPRATLVADASWLEEEEPIASVDGNVAYLLDTAAMSSLDEVEHELAMILGEFEM